MNSTFLASASADHGLPDECELLGPFAILVQGALGALALLSLVFKRWRERPQRPVKVWAFDVSKQVVGSVLLHLANLLMSMFSAGEIEASIALAAAEKLANGSTESSARDVYKPNPCSFYLLNIAIDTTLGIPILILLLKIITIGITQLSLASPPESIKSGNYGSPPKATWWLKQSIIYFFGLVCMKICVLLIFQLCPWIVIVGDWALKWTEGNAAVQIAFVMFIFPLIMNVMQYYIIDTFIKHKHIEDDSDAQGSHHGSDGEEERFLAEDEEEGRGSSIDEDEAYKRDIRRATRKYPKRSVTPYDPTKDGEAGVGGAESNGSGSGSGSGSTSTPGHHSRHASRSRER